MSNLPPGLDVQCREVGLRDGLQIVDTVVPTDQKIAWIEAELAAGVSEIEATSFVPPKLLPQFGDAQEVTEAALALSSAAISGLVPNSKGASRAFDLGVQKVNYVTSVSESHNQANVSRSVAESVADFSNIVNLRDGLTADQKPKLAVTLSTSFGCSIEGAIRQESTLSLVEQFVLAGADEIVVADTVGYANPVAVKTMCTQLVAEHENNVDLGCHFHDTRGLGLANVYASIETGIRRFDASLAGLGGCPYAPLATGNIVMEDLVFMCEAAGLNTGIDLERLVEVRKIVASSLPNEPLYGLYAKAGRPKGM